MLNRTYNVVKNYLSENLKEALDLAEQMNSENDSFEWTETWDWEELCEMAAKSGKDAVDELVRGAINGQTYGGRVRYDGWGNIVSGEEDDLLADTLSYLDDIMNELKDYIEDDGYVRYLIVSYELQEVIDKSIKVKVRVSDIIYDISEEEDITVDDLNDMPKELVLEMNLIGEEEIDTDELTDLISDETGWIIENYNFEIMED